MTITVITCVLIGAGAVLTGLFMILRYKGDVDVNADFKQWKLSVKKKK